MASLVKVVYVVVMDTVLGFSILHQLEPRANYLWILLEYSLSIFCSIEGHLELI
jgi:sorbitol-specific phosphotransferase system component IIBC